MRLEEGVLFVPGLHLISVEYVGRCDDGLMNRQRSAEKEHGMGGIPVVVDVPPGIDGTVQNKLNKQAVIILLKM